MLWTNFHAPVAYKLNVYNKNNGVCVFEASLSAYTHTHTHKIHRNLLTLGAFVFISEEGLLISSNHILGLAKISYFEVGVV